MIRNNNMLFTLSIFFLTLICLSTIYSVSPKNEFSFNIEENAKADGSESSNSQEKEIKEAKILFGSDFTLEYSSQEEVVRSEYILSLKSMFQPETNTPPPKLV